MVLDGSEMETCALISLQSVGWYARMNSAVLQRYYDVIQPICSARKDIIRKHLIFNQDLAGKRWSGHGSFSAADILRLIVSDLNELLEEEQAFFKTQLVKYSSSMHRPLFAKLLKRGSSRTVLSISAN